MGVEDQTRHTAIGRMASASGLLGRGRSFLGRHFEWMYDERRGDRESIEGEDSHARITGDEKTRRGGGSESREENKREEREEKSRRGFRAL